MTLSSQGKWQYAGTIKWLEPFVSLEPQTLHFKALVNMCANNTEQRWYFVVSPQPSTHGVWAELDQIAIKPC